MTTLRYVAVAGPIKPDNSYAPEALKKFTLTSLTERKPQDSTETRRSLEHLSDQALEEFATHMGNYEFSEDTFPIGAFFGLRRTILRYAPSRLILQFLVPAGRDHDYLVAVAKVANHVASRRLEVEVLPPQITELPVASFFDDPELCAAAVADLLDLRPAAEEMAIVDAFVGSQHIKNPLLRMAAEVKAPVVLHGNLELGPTIPGSAYLAYLAHGLQPPAEWQDIPRHIVPFAGYRPTRAALDQLNRTKWNVNGGYSATVDVLRTLKDGYGRAEELAELVARWLDLRIFDGSMVTEMVLHDESHAMSVDRNVSIIAGALARTGAITADDLFRLGCAAWLHDCGHSSAVIGKGQQRGVPTDTEFIRSFHGSLSERRIRRLRSELGLQKADAAWVRVLSKHHQGWTSLDSDPGNPIASTDDPERAVLRDPAGYASMLTAGLATTLSKVKITREQLTMATPDGSTSQVEGDNTLERAHALIALLRLCDALDMGRHRVRHRDLHYAQLDTFVWTYAQRCIDGIDQGEPTARLITSIRKVARQVARLVLRNDRHEYEKQRELILDSLDRVEHLDQASQKRVRGWTDSLISYCDHIFAQAKHFRIHSSINTVIPLVRTNGERHQLEVMVVPDRADDEKAVQEVEKYVRKELGLADDGDSFAQRAPIRNAFDRALGMPLDHDGELAVKIYIPQWWQEYKTARDDYSSVPPRVATEDTPMDQAEAEAAAQQSSAAATTESP